MGGRRCGGDGGLGRVDSAVSGGLGGAADNSGNGLGDVGHAGGVGSVSVTSEVDTGGGCCGSGGVDRVGEKAGGFGDMGGVCGELLRENAALKVYA